MSAPHYSPLQSNLGEIRLLQLNPAGTVGAPLDCSLERAFLSSNPRFEALSYTWGEPGTEQIILLDGTEFRIRENLSAALRRLRHASQPRRLWTDVICVNQDDLDERRDQILLMGSIYQNAEQVVVWLGELTAESIVGIKMLDNWFKFSWQHFKSERQRNVYSLSHWKNVLSDSASLEERSNYSEEHGFGEVRELLDRPWWRRVWIVQEAVLAQTLVVLCGTETIQWESFQSAIQGGSLKLGKHAAGHKRPSALSDWPDASYQAISLLRQERKHTEWKKSIYDLAYSFRTSECTDPRDRIYAFLGLATDLDGAGISPSYYLSIAEAYTNFARTCIKHHSHLKILNCKRQQYQEDVAESQIRAYSVNDQARYHDTEAQITDGKKTRVGWAPLPHGWERIQDGKVSFFRDHLSGKESSISPLAALAPSREIPFEMRRISPPGWTKTWDNVGRAKIRFTGDSYLSKAATSVSNLHLPSWVPDWASSSTRDPAPLLDFSAAQPRFFASGQDTTCRISPQDDVHQLNLEGVLFDEIEKLAPAWHPTSIQPPLSRKGVKILEEWETLALAPVPSCPYNSWSSREEAFMRTQLCDSRSDESLPPQTNTYFDVWRDGAKWAPDAPEYTGKAYYQAWYEDSKRTFAEVHMLKYHMKLTFGKAGLPGWDEKSQSIIQGYNECAQSIYRASAHRAIFVTRKGYIGLAPWNAKLGDQVSVLLGGHTPFLLRPLPEPSTFTLVGESYVYGLMKGEIFQGETKPKIETICLV
ncbi:HET-domain-containing protein [Rhizodiscina lignyota]|uniref:HET-domain-containing protein n=1 Tax=Rhizodiscina lignyota TaxID=1504668 RepID=A0A9P4IGK8_9PEZI|nr:HET-domain-containing protein [Rhizodiscina lignyota]